MGYKGFVLVIVARKLKLYFQAHTVIVLMDKPLRRAISSPETAGRMASWVVELSKFNIQYRPHTAIKGQAVASFIAEFTHMEGQGVEEVPQWSIHTNGSSNKQVGGADVVLHTPEGYKIECMVHLDFSTINNEV